VFFRRPGGTFQARVDRDCLTKVFIAHRFFFLFKRQKRGRHVESMHVHVVEEMKTATELQYRVYAIPAGTVESGCLLGKTGFAAQFIISRFPRKTQPCFDLPRGRSKLVVPYAGS